MVRSFAYAGMLWIVSGVAAAAAQAPDAAAEADMFQRVNALRRAAGLDPFERHPALDAAARTHAADMAWHGDLSHVSERTGDPGARVAAAGLEAAAVGENIARNETTLAAHQALVASEPHLANLMSSDYTHIGIAARADDDGDVWVTQVFARPEAQAAAPQAAASQAAVPEVPSAPPEPPAASVPAAPPSPAPQLGAPYVGGAVVGAQAPGAPGRQVIGYWVFSRGRWWYYRLPPNARHGQELEADPNVVGPPPGYGPAGYRPGYRVQGQAPAAPVQYYGGRAHRPRPTRHQAAPPFGWSPRRHYPQWRSHR